MSIATCACSGAREANSPPHAVLEATHQEERAETLLQLGLSLARAGEGSRAEQYLVAALQEGAAWERVVVPLVQLCVASARYQSALRYVQEALDRDPESAELHYLAVSLGLSLDKDELVRHHVEQLTRLAELPQETLLFLGDYYGEEDAQRAGQYYCRYLRRSPHGAGAARARSRLRSPSPGVPFGPPHAETESLDCADLGSVPVAQGGALEPGYRQQAEATAPRSRL